MSEFSKFHADRIPRWSLVAVVAVAALVAVSCEKSQEGKAEESATPERATVETGSKNEIRKDREAAVEDPASKSPGDSDAETDPSQPEEDPPEPEFSDPELKVYRDGEKIVVEGALKSRIQIERIASQLEAAFSGTRVESSLELDFSRHGVGWGNRVTEQFLIPYLDRIEDPVVDYRDGVITLKGTGGTGDFRFFQELAIEVFAGIGSRKLDNQIKVAN